MMSEEEVKKLREEMELLKQELREQVCAHNALAGALLALEKQVVHLCKLNGVDLGPDCLNFLEKSARALDEEHQRQGEVVE